jgi:hypothetical protein
MRTRTSFQKGNQFGAHHNHGRARMITQQLISALNEPYLKTDLTKMRKPVDQLIELAIGGEVVAIKEIFDRVEAKPIPVVTAGDENERPVSGRKGRSA